MKTNAYTMSIDNIHVSESAIEAALAAAKLRAAKTASAQAKVRYAAIAASVVLAGAASAAYFGNIMRFEPPVSPLPNATEVSSTEPGQPTESETVKGSAEKPTAKSESTNAAESTESPINFSETVNAPAPTAPPAEQTPDATQAPQAPTAAATEPDPAETPTEQDPLPEVDRSQLCADGKLFIAFAATGMEQIDDPVAFSDDHLYYIETKFGRYYRIQPPQIKHIDLSLNNDTPKSDEMVYLYNSDGEIIGQAPIWW